MTWASFLRAASLAAVVTMFVTDKAFGLWREPPDLYVYLFLTALALGVDAAWLRDRLKALIGVDTRGDRS